MTDGRFVKDSNTLRSYDPRLDSEDESNKISIAVQQKYVIQE